MACRNAYKTKAAAGKTLPSPAAVAAGAVPNVPKTATRLLFGVHSRTPANDHLQNNLDELEWIIRNKIHPNFYGRYLTGANCLTKEEIVFLHRRGYRIAAIGANDGPKQTKAEGKRLANTLTTRAFELGIPMGTAIFLEIAEDENAKCDFLRGYAEEMIEDGFTPGFMANTDAAFSFDREFSRMVKSNPELLGQCLIWATAPTVKEYDGITTSHLIHPDLWMPYAPSAISRAEIAIWQYGINCHPIEDDAGEVTTFNLDLVRNRQVITEKTF